MNLDNSESQLSSRLFDRVLASKQNLVAVETVDVADVMAQFRQFALRSGQSIYQWQDDLGISSLREGEVRVPGSKRMADALRYILQSMHFGIYIFTEAEGHLRPPNTGLLRQIGRARGGNERKVVFIGAKLNMPESLEEVTEHLSVERIMPQRPRLRDGRWVI
ncbi:hypothetical protein DFR29_11683 [Tahibacter aquaticus]|uniref:AAA domain-containing protein n=1 Tax=Tahibacter aquaticus TaxID=520092 RepID=A0A4R6YPA5_9GAMM|nr:hypothetical protein [Tahibacter aquaticus]TDR39382.1 hypothetical protein DFR29_11683 [Tahibacter aquaticus]